jgi:hypothetical protein
MTIVWSLLAIAFVLAPACIGILLWRNATVPVVVVRRREVS